MGAGPGGCPEWSENDSDEELWDGYSCVYEACEEPTDCSAYRFTKSTPPISLTL